MESAKHGGLDEISIGRNHYHINIFVGSFAGN